MDRNSVSEEEENFLYQSIRIKPIIKYVPYQPERATGQSKKRGIPTSVAELIAMRSKVAATGAAGFSAPELTKIVTDFQMVDKPKKLKKKESIEVILKYIDQH